MIQSEELQRLCAVALPVHIFLKNGIKLFGKIKEFDPFIVVLGNEVSSQMVYKHTIATILESTTSG